MQEAEREKAGFTLIEFVMAIVIVGILVAIAIPRFESYFVIKLDGAARKAASDVRYVQQFAVSRHTNSRIEFDASSNRYRACFCNEADGKCGSGTCGSANWSPIPDPFTRADLVVDFTTDAQYRGISVENTITFQFDWQGVPVAGGSVSLEYRGDTRMISVEEQTGMVRIE